MKVVFRQVGAVRLAATRATSASRTRCTRRSSSRKLWSYFVPVAPDRATQAALEALYRDGYQVRPVLEAILQHPAVYDGPADGEAAGRPRRRAAPPDRRRNHTTDWSWIGALSGQQLFYPPNVAGWDDTRWLDTATYRGRWIAVQRILQDRKLDPAKGTKTRRRADGASRRRSPSGTTHPCRPRHTRRCCTSRARALADAGKQHWKQVQYPVLLENALRQLIAVSPDLQTS